MDNKTVIKTIKLDKEIKDLTEVLNNLKGKFREDANGETKTYEAPGLGKITVSKPGGGVTSTNTITSFDVEAFKALPKKMQTTLMEKGVVTVKTVTSTSSITLAAVKVSHNV